MLKIDTAPPICTCFQCGFHSEGHDPIDCKFRGLHSDPCEECSNSFHVFADIFKLHDRVDVKLREEKRYETNGVLEDDMGAWHDEIHECLRNFLDYRQHIAQAEDEGIFDSRFYEGLKEDECIIIVDFKMKILASCYREKQKDWFSKRGFSCLGCMIIFGSASDSDENEVLYHIFLSDDTTQDCNFVNTVKE